MTVANLATDCPVLRPMGQSKIYRFTAWPGTPQAFVAIRCMTSPLGAQRKRKGNSLQAIEADSPAAGLRAPLTVSVVSHGHGEWLPGLLQQLAATGAGLIAHVVLTHNLPETGVSLLEVDYPFRLTQRTNTHPCGFGCNHNRAFALADTPWFCVLNPDISLPDTGLWPDLLQCVQGPAVGCAFPVLLNPDGSVQDNAREVPTPLALFRRRMLGRDDSRVDWASGAFWVVSAQVFRSLGGFNERYFLYCEDTDFCLRMQLRGWALVQGRSHAVHHAQRSSHRRWRHLAWHVASLLRLWTSRALWDYIRRRS